MTSPLVATPLGSTVHAVWLRQNNVVATNVNSWRGPQELQTDCPICLVVLREPFQVMCCGYSFCRTCIKPILTNKMACLTCNEASFNAFPNKGLQRSLYSFCVRCIHQKSGCEWTGELRELDGHLNLNTELSKLYGCAFAAVTCTHCCKYFQRHHVQSHKSGSCSQCPFSCEYCEDYSSMYEDVVNNHWPVCKCYPVPCPNECGASPERQNVKTQSCEHCMSPHSGQLRLPLCWL